MIYKYWSPVKDSQLPYDIINEIQKYLIVAERNYYGPENRLPIKELNHYFPEYYIKNVMKVKGCPMKNPQKPDGLKITDKFECFRKLFRMNVYDGKGCTFNPGLIKINNRYYVNRCLLNRVREGVQLIKRILKAYLD